MDEEKVTFAERLQNAKKNCGKWVQLLLYLLFLIAWSWMLILQMKSDQVYDIKKGVLDDLDGEWSVAPPKRYSDIASENDIFAWLEKSILNGMYGQSTWLPDSQVVIDKVEAREWQNFIRKFNYYYGVKLLQNRVREVPDCKWTKYVSCRDGSKPGTTFMVNLTESLARYAGNDTDPNSDLNIELAFVTNKAFNPPGGEKPGVYRYFIDNDQADTTWPNFQIHLLRDFLWIDLFSKDLTVTIPVYNVVNKIFLLMNYQFSFTEGGRIDSQATIDFVIVPGGSEPIEIWLIILEIFVMVCILALAINEIVECVKEGKELKEKHPEHSFGRRVLGTLKAHYSSAWNYYDTVLISLLVTCVALYIGVLVASAEIPLPSELNDLVNAVATSYEDSLKVLESIVDDIQKTSQSFNSYATIAGITTLLLFGKGLYYMGFSNTLNILSKTLGRASGQLASFSVLFLFLFLAFTLFAYIVFGPKLEPFHERWGAVMTTSAFLFGAANVNYSDLKDSNPAAAPIWFWAFSLLTVLILTNVFVAILSEYYTVIAEEKKKREEEKKQRRSQMRASGGADLKGEKSENIELEEKKSDD